MSQSSNESKKPSLFSKIEEDMIAATLEGIMPKIAPLIEPAVKKISEFLGENEKFIILRKMPGKSPTVIVLDNTAGNYEISKLDDSQIFSADNSAINGVHEVDTFIKALISGNFKMD